MKKVLFKDIRAGQVFFYGDSRYSKLTTNLTINQQQRCNVAKSSKINAVKIDKTDGIWLEQEEEVEIELR